jgi:hypothetical protein
LFSPSDPAATAKPSSGISSISWTVSMEVSTLRPKTYAPEGSEATENGRPLDAASEKRGQDRRKPSLSSGSR